MAKLPPKKKSTQKDADNETMMPGKFGKSEDRKEANKQKLRAYVRSMKK